MDFTAEYFPGYDPLLHKRAEQYAQDLQMELGPFGNVIAEAYIDLLSRRGLPPTLICHPTIQLRSGNYFNFLIPDAMPPTLDDIAWGAAKAARFCGQDQGELAYTVAQHQVLGSRVAPPEVQFEFLMHDTPESLLGDMTTPLKQLCPDYKKIEEIVASSFARRFKLPQRMSADCKEVDIRMALTEKNAFMAKDPSGREWTLTKGWTPYPIHMEKWIPVKAAWEWKNRFYELYPQHLARIGATDDEGLLAGRQP